MTTIKTPTVTLTAYNMGDVNEQDYTMWIDYVSDRIDAAAGFEVGVDAAPFRGGPDADQINYATEAQRDAITEALRSLWDSWCATGWDEAYKAAGIQS